MEHLETITRIISVNIDKTKEELVELILAELPSIDRQKCEKVVASVSEKCEKIVDIVVPDAVEVVVAEVVGVSVQQVRVSMKKKFFAFLKSLFLSCMHTTAVRVSHPQAPAAIPVVPEAEPSVDNEPPPLEPSPEKV